MTKKNRKNITQIRVNIIRAMANSDVAVLSARSIEKAIKSNNLTIKPHLEWWASQRIIKPIKVENRVLGWELNTDLLGLLFATGIQDEDLMGEKLK